MHGDAVRNRSCIFRERRELLICIECGRFTAMMALASFVMEMDLRLLFLVYQGCWFGERRWNFHDVSNRINTWFSHR